MSFAAAKRCERETANLCVTEGARRLQGARGRRAECTASVSPFSCPVHSGAPLSIRLGPLPRAWAFGTVRLRGENEHCRSQPPLLDGNARRRREKCQVWVGGKLLARREEYSRSNRSLGIALESSYSHQDTRSRPSDARTWTDRQARTLDDSSRLRLWMYSE